MSNKTETHVLTTAISDAALVAKIDEMILALVSRYPDRAVFALEAFEQLSHRRLMDALWLPRQRASAARARAVEAAQLLCDEAKPFELPVK